ncbi:hypothetical protein APHAL10511_006741 [Amanita phalloides]|nr:hypothetical protein APHAL10511_006741 [Amanita phalloides]
MSDKGRKYHPRRLFSFDSLKSSRPSEGQHSYGRRTTVYSEADQPTEDPFGDRPGDAGTLNNEPGDVYKPSGQPTTTSVASSPEQPSRPSTADSTAESTASRARWDKIRQHVLLSAASAQQSSPQPQPAPRTFSSSSRSTTPKPSRFPRLGLRHVVEQAREVAEDKRIFANEIHKACWISRYPEQYRSNSSMSSTLYLPFMTNASLSGASGMSNSGVFKRQDTMASQSTLPSPSSPLGQRLVPSLKPLWQLLMTYATPSANGVLRCAVLPHETLVLSVLQDPFLKANQSEGGVPDERRFAMESFEIIFKTWFPNNEISFVNHCLWCCSAAMTTPGRLRLRALNGIHGLLGSREVKLIFTPVAFQSLASGLLNLLGISMTNQMFLEDTDATTIIQSCLNLIRSGACVALDTKVMHERYGAVYSEHNEEGTYGLLLLGSLAKCIETTTGLTRTWLIQYACNDGWVPLRKEGASSSLATALHVEKLNSTSHAMAHILSPHETSRGLSDSDIILLLQLLETRLIPEIELLQVEKAAMVRQTVAKIVLHAAISNRHDSLNQWTSAAIREWYRTSARWKGALELVVRDLINDEAWKTVLKALNSLLQLADDPACQNIFAFALPLIHQRIVEDPPPFPSPDLSNLLGLLSYQYPHMFYKSLFSCAASAKEYVVIDHLRTMTTVAKYVPDFLVRDAEMICVALVNDIGKKTELTPPTFKAARLGQLVILVELIVQAQIARHRKDELPHADGALFNVIKFLVSLEARLSVLLGAREKEFLYPFSHRVLYCILFREIRLLTRSSKPVTWLSTIVTWFVDYYNEELVSGAEYDELEDTLSRLQALYEAAQIGVQSPVNQRRTMILSARSACIDASEDQRKDEILQPLSRGLHVLNSAQKGFAAKAMKLLVLVSTFMTMEDFGRLGPVIWEHGLCESTPSALNPACYLAMQCAEKTPTDFLATIEVDVKSSDDLTRLKALEKLGILCHRRFDLASQQVITDRNRRALKLARSPLPFDPTDMGSSSYTPDDGPEQGQNVIPYELKKQLAEIGWTQEGLLGDQRQEWLHKPMLLMPVHHFGRLETSENSLLVLTEYPSPLLTPQSSPFFSSSEKFNDQQLLRRNSSTGGPIYVARRKTVFVPSLAAALSRIATLAFDSNIAIASVARVLIFDLMRNDPSLLTRPILDLFSDEEKDVHSATSTLNLLLNVHKAVPPSMAHYVFNHLAGYLKTIARQSDRYDLVHDYARTIPLLAELVPHVSGMSIRELRRSKLDFYFVPTGSLWFPKPTPNEHMFPTELFISRNSLESLPSTLVSIALIRISQNLLLASMLRKNQQDVQFIRKHLSRLELPSLDEIPTLLDLELRDFLPWEASRRTPRVNDTLRTLSLMLSRSYLLLVAQTFPLMSRHLSDRNELALFIDGINRILLVHGDDIGIVGQALIILMIASTRFRRLFVSGGVYTLFMPGILKVYAESEKYYGIRCAIEYTIGRFYAQYKDAFIFQSLDVISRLAAYPLVAEDKFGRSVFDLFACLRQGVSPSTHDAAGIHNANKEQEREALILHTAEEKPQTFLASIRHGKAEDSGRITFDIPEEFQASRLRITDFIKLFLTIIAHDLSSLRAENFLKLFRLIVPHMYQVSTAGRPTLQEGIDALGAILVKPPARTKPTSSEQDDSLLADQGTDKPSGPSRSQSDLMTMRLDYLSLIVAFSRAGGTVKQSTIHRIIDMVKNILKESDGNCDRISIFLCDFTEASLLRGSPPSVKGVTAYLRDLASIIATHGATLDLTRIFAVLIEISAMPLYSGDDMFARVLSSEICHAALAACALAGRDKMIMSLPYRPHLVELLSQAVHLRGANVAVELEKHMPTHDYLAGIILPLVMTLRKESPLPSVANQPNSRRSSPDFHLWVRLLQYTLSACQNNQRLYGSEGSDKKSLDRRRSTESAPTVVTTFVVSLQVIKAILVRAGDELCVRLPAFWSRMASFFRSVLEQGNAEFALRPPEYSLPSSPFVSPTMTPRTSFQLDASRPPAKTEIQSFTTQHSFLCPRVVDYAMWSLFELLCSYRSPLLLQMRLLIVDKVLDLDQALKFRWHLFSPSPALIPPVSASVFSKPYRRASKASSAATSPRIPHRSESLQTSGYLNVSDSRKPGYRSQHMYLGPTSSPLLEPALPGGNGGISLMTKTARIKSPSLSRATYRRIRILQKYLGYHDILPLPYHEGMEVDRDEVILSSWTKYQALKAIMDETDELMEEFGELRNDFDDNTINIEPEEYSTDKVTNV